MPQFFKHDENDTIFWANGEHYGEILFSFNKEKVYNLFEDYPHSLSAEEKEIFDEENPFWKNYFSGWEGK